MAGHGARFIRMRVGSDTLRAGKCIRKVVAEGAGAGNMSQLVTFRTADGGGGLVSSRWWRGVVRSGPYSLPFVCFLLPRIISFRSFSISVEFVLDCSGSCYRRT